MIGSVKVSTIIHSSGQVNRFITKCEQQITFAVIRNNFELKKCSVRWSEAPSGAFLLVSSKICARVHRVPIQLNGILRHIASRPLKYKYLAQN